MAHTADAARLADLDRQIRLLENEIVVKLAAEDFMEFLKFMADDPAHSDDFTRTTYDVQPHHVFLAKMFSDVEAGKYNGRVIVISLPPRSGKTHQAKLFVAWFLGRHLDQHLIYCTYNNDFAGEIGNEVRGVLQSDRFKRVFPKLALSRGAAASDYMKTTKGGQAKFAGAQGSVTGKGGHILLVDDLFKDAKEADSIAIREHRWQWFAQTFSSRKMHSDVPIICIGTRWHEDDVIGRLTDPDNPNYHPLFGDQVEVINLPAIAGEDDPLGRQPGDLLWEMHVAPGGITRGFTRAGLELERAKNPRSFEALYQGNPTPLDSPYFKREWMQYYDPAQLPAKLRVYAASDHAVSTKQRADKTVMIVAGVDQADNIYILDVWWQQADTPIVVDQMLAMMKKWRPLLWWGERGHITRSFGPFLRKRMSEESVYVTIEDVTPTTDKLARAQAILARMSMGKVFFPRYRAWTEKALNELVKFPNGTHDDFVDAIAWLGLELNRITAPSMHRRPEVKDHQRTGTLAWVKARSEAEKRRRKMKAAAAGF